MQPIRFVFFLSFIFCLMQNVRVPADEVADAVTRLRSGSDEARYDAARTLRKLGPKAIPAIDALIAALSDDGVPHQFKLQYFGPRVQDAASTALVKIGAPSVPRLVAALENENPEIQQWSATTLGRLGPLSRSSFPKLRELLKELNEQEADEWEDVQWEVIDAIGKVGERPETVVPILAETFRTQKDEFIRSAALSALPDADPSGTLVLPILLEGLDDGEIMAASVQALGELGPRASSATDELLKRIHTKKTRGDAYFDVVWPASVQVDIIRALGKIGPDARVALPELTQLMNESGYPLPQVWAAAAIVRIAPDAPIAETAFAKVAGSREFEALSQIGSKAAVSVLIEKLKSEEISFENVAPSLIIEAIGHCGPVAEDAVPILMELLTIPWDKGFKVKRQAMIALGKIGAPAQPALPLLRRIRDAPADQFSKWEDSDRAEEAIDKIQAALEVK